MEYGTNEISNHMGQKKNRSIVMQSAAKLVHPQFQTMGLVFLSVSLPSQLRFDL